MTMTRVTQYQLYRVFFFFFQAEDGIRDVAVTGVQTCALPISPGVFLPNFEIIIDIRELLQTLTTVHHNGLQNPLIKLKLAAEAAQILSSVEIGRASCRERV